MGWLNNMVVLFLIFWWISLLFSITVVPIYSLTDNVWEFLFLPVPVSLLNVFIFYWTGVDLQFVFQVYSGVFSYTYNLFQILFPFTFLQNIEHSSLCYTVGLCWLSILNIDMYLYAYVSIPNSQFIPYIYMCIYMYIYVNPKFPI